MASKHQKRSSSALDPMMAGFAAGAAAFIIYAMPQARFDEAVSLSGLPMILSAAQPPLGTTARIAAMLVAGIGSFLLVWLVLRALSKPAPKLKHRSGPVEIEMAPPRLRRADAHPDAPSRRPILAGIDLGRPFDEMPLGEQEMPLGEQEISLGEQEMPLGEQDSVAPIFDGEDQPLDALLTEERQPWDDGLDHEQEETHELPAPGTHYVDDYVPPFALESARDPSAEEESEQVGKWLAREEDYLDELGFDEGGEAEEAPEIAADDPVADLPLWEEPAEEEPFEETPLDLSPPEVETVQALPEPVADADDHRAGSIPNLMERLEAGLRRRQPDRWLPSASGHHPSNGSAEASDGAPPQLDARLRGAIQELQKLAARGN